MSETTSLTAPKVSFDRRAVVKGAAWSVPVIAAAIAAPAAAASAGNAAANFDGYSTQTKKWTTVSFAPPPGNVKARSGTGPTGFTISNPKGAITGLITGTVTIVPDVAGKNDPGVGITTLTGATSFAGNLDADKVFVGTFQYSGGIPGNSAVVFSIDSSSYYFTGGNGSPARDFTISVSLTIPGRPGKLNIAPVPLHIAKN